MFDVLSQCWKEKETRKFLIKVLTKGKEDSFWSKPQKQEGCAITLWINDRGAKFSAPLFVQPWNKGFAAESSPFTIYVTTFPSAATGSYYGLLDFISTCYFEIQPLTAFDSTTVWKVIIMWLRWHKLKVDSKLNLKWHWNALIKSTKNLSNSSFKTLSVWSLSSIQ